MGRKSKTEREIDRSIGEWKQKLLYEAQDLVTGDFADMQDWLRNAVGLMKQHEQKARQAIREAKQAQQSIQENQRKFTKDFIIWTSICWLLGSAVGTGLTFILIRYFW